MLRKIEVTMFPDGRLDAKNTAIYLGLSVKTLAMMRCNATGPVFIKRGRIFYFKDDLDEWLQEGRSGSTAEASMESKRGTSLNPKKHRVQHRE